MLGNHGALVRSFYWQKIHSDNASGVGGDISILQKLVYCSKPRLNISHELEHMRIGLYRKKWDNITLILEPWSIQKNEHPPRFGTLLFSTHPLACVAALPALQVALGGRLHRHPLASLVVGLRQARPG